MKFNPRVILFIIWVLAFLHAELYAVGITGGPAAQAPGDHDDQGQLRDRLGEGKIRPQELKDLLREYEVSTAPFLRQLNKFVPILEKVKAKDPDLQVVVNNLVTMMRGERFRLAEEYQNIIKIDPDALHLDVDQTNDARKNLEKAIIDQQKSLFALVYAIHVTDIVKDLNKGKIPFEGKADAKRMAVQQEAAQRTALDLSAEMKRSMPAFKIPKEDWGAIYGEDTSKDESKYQRFLLSYGRLGINGWNQQLDRDLKTRIEKTIVRDMDEVQLDRIDRNQADYGKKTDADWKKVWEALEPVIDAPNLGR